MITAPVVAQGQTVTATWDPSPPNDQVTSYQVCTGTTSLSCNVQLASVTSTQTVHTLSPTPGVVHYVAVRAINSSGTGSYSTETSFSIPSLVQPVNQSSPVGVAIAPLTLSVSDPDGSPITFTHTGLPPGLSLNSTTGQISGTPSGAGTYQVTVFVTDSLVTVSRSFAWTITAPATDTMAPALSITSYTDGQTVSTSSITLSGTATDSGRGGNGVSRVTVNGQAAAGGSAAGSGTASWSQLLTLSPGANAITVEAADSKGNTVTQIITLNYSLSSVSGATLSVSAASPQDAGTAVTFTASGSGGVGPREFKFFVQPSGGSAQMVRDWSTTTSYTWTPATANTYTVIVWARSAGVTVDAAQASAQMAYTINTPPPAPVTSVALSSNLPTPQVAGTAVTFTAVGVGGVAPREYKFLVQQGGGTNQMAQNWSPSATFTWTPTVAANYTVIVWARSAGATSDVAQALAQVAYVIDPTPLAPVTGATLSATVASPQNAGTAVTFTASGSGGVGPREFKFFVQPSGGGVQMVRDWSTTTTYTWTPATANSYTVIAWARSSGATVDAPQASAQMPYVISTLSEPVTITGLTSNPASPENPGTSITFTVATAGGTAPGQFKWWVFDGNSWTMARDWSPATTYVWTPTIEGAYRIGVWARDATSTADVGTVNTSVPYRIRVAKTPPPPPADALTITGLTSDVSSPQVSGTTITFTAAATGGTAPYQFKWWIFDGESWTMVRDWNPATTYVWTPTSPGAYRIGIWARDATTTADIGTVNLSVPFRVRGKPAPAPPPPPEPVTIIGLTSNPKSPQLTGTSITFTALATGGTSPLQFKWWIFDGVNWTLARDWSTSSTYTWIPTNAGAHRIGVWVRDGTSTADVGDVNLSVPYRIR